MASLITFSLDHADTCSPGAVEPYFSALKDTGLANTHYRTPDAINHGLSEAMQCLDGNPMPYRWTKP